MERVAFFLITIITFITIHGVTASSNADPIVPALFIFGDSYVDSGNNNNINTSTLDQANFPPYGENFTGSVPTGRFTNGQTIPDFIAKKAGFNSLTPVYLSTTRNWKKYEGKNFASGGAGALKETLKGYVIDLQTQMENFKTELIDLKKNNKKKYQNIVSKALYLVNIGSSDYTSPFLANDLKFLNSFAEQDYVKMVIGNISTLIEEIINIGGNTIVITNVSLLDRLPGLRRSKNARKNGQGCFKKVSDLSKMHNKALRQWRSNFTSTNMANIVLYDLASDISQMTEHPRDYGLTEVNTACCGSGNFNGVFNCGGKFRKPLSEEFSLCKNPNEHLYFDAYHYSENVYKQVSDKMWEAVVEILNYQS